MNKLAVILNKDKILIIVALCAMIFFLFPLWSVTSIDEEEFRYAIVSTVIHVRALFSGQYPIWTSYFGFGMPHPFLINFNYHPFLVLFYFNTNIAIQCMYAVHLFIGAMGVFMLCRLFAARNISIVGAIAFIFSSPTINYIYTDFWISTFVGWTILPWLYFTATRIVNSCCKKEMIYFSVFLSFIISFLILNSHPSQALIYCMSLLMYFFSYFDRLLGRLKYLAVTGLLVVATVASKIQYTITEASKFTSDLIIFKKPFSFEDLWDIFLRPIVFGTPSYIVKYNLQHGSRGLFVGGIFVVVAIITSIYLRKISSVRRFSFNFILLSTIYVIRPDFIYTILSTINVLREPLIIFVILLSVVGLNHLYCHSLKNKNLPNCLVIIQLILVIGNIIPFWWYLISADNDKNEYPIVLKNLLENPKAIEKLRNHILEDDARIYITNKVASDFGSKKLKDFGISANSLPFFGLTVVNGYFKGISYENACKGPYIYGKLYDDYNCKIENQAFLEIGSVDYVIKYNNNDIYINSLNKICDIGDGPKGILGLYKNEKAWDEAVVLSKEAINSNLPLKEGCYDNNLGCSDISVLYNHLIENKKINVFREGNRIILHLNGRIEENQFVMMSDFAHEGWIAKWYGDNKNGNLTIQKVANFFVGISPPKNANIITLEYHDDIRKYLEYLSIISMFIMSFFLIVNFLKFRGKINK